jgi:hypothetical protein
MSLVLTDNQYVVLGVAPKSAAGNPAPIESPIWSVSDESIVTLTVSEDGLTATVETTGTVGNAQVKFSCDARIGEGESPLFAILDIEVVASEAVNISITADVKTKPIPAEPPAEPVVDPAV